MSSGCDEAVLSAFLTRDTIFRLRKKFFERKAAGLVKGNEYAPDYSFRSLKDMRQSLVIQKLPPAFVTKNFDLSEDLAPETFKKLTRIVLERGRWFICAQKHLTTTGCAETQGLKVVAIDPGVRTFATTYTDDQCSTYGEGFYAEKVFSLLLQINKLVGIHKRANSEQWKRHYQKRIDRKINRARDLVHDLHKQVAFDLVSQFDVILLPSFETKQMASTQDR